MSFLKSYTSTDRKLLLVAIIGILICLYFLLFGEGNSDYDRSADVKIGTVKNLANDNRQKPNGVFVWDEIRKNQNIYAGDTIYSGRKSSLKLELTNGSVISIDENSMMTFEVLDGQSKIDIENGNFNLKIVGRAQIDSNGQTTRIDGNKGPISISFKKNQKPEIKKQAQQPRNQNTIQIDPTFNANSRKYVWRLYDRYQKIDSGIQLRKSAPISIKTLQNFSWNHLPPGEVTVQHSRFPDFKESLIYTTTQKTHTIKEVFVGQNHWRVSVDGSNWMKPQSFNVFPQFLPEAAPTSGLRPGRYPMVSEELQLRLPLTSPIETIGFVTQVSNSQGFEPHLSHSFWSSTTNAKLMFRKPGVYFVRSQGVDKTQNLTEWSDTVQLEIFKPSPPLAPLAEEENIKRFVGENVELSWRSNPLRTKIVIYDKNNRIVRKLDGSQFRWVAKKPGIYRASAYQVNEYGQKSPTSKVSNIEILPLTAALSEETANKQERKPAFTDNTIKSKYEVPKYRYLNDNYKSDQIAVQGMLWTIQSTEQDLAGEAAPFATGLAVHGYYWKGSHGFEGTIKSGIIGLNDTGSEGTSLKSFEPRYHYRFISRSPFKFTPELMYSFFAGYELYRNSATSISNRYDLLKFGTALEFPVSKRWATGGEFVFGLGLDSSKKFEMSGNLHYFFDPEWSFGGGYRLHMFEAGSSSASPTGILPYREGYTEGFSTLNYYF